MVLKEYYFKFTQLSMSAPTMVAESSMSKFISGVFEIVMNECRTKNLIKEIDIFRLMTHA